MRIHEERRLLIKKLALMPSWTCSSCKVQNKHMEHGLHVHFISLMCVLPCVSWHGELPLQWRQRDEACTLGFTLPVRAPCVAPSGTGPSVPIFSFAHVSSGQWRWALASCASLQTPPPHLAVTLKVFAAPGLCAADEVSRHG